MHKISGNQPPAFRCCDQDGVGNTITSHGNLPVQIDRQYMLFNAGIVLAIFLLAIISEYSGFDIFFASQFYDDIHHVWIYRETFVTAYLFHDMGKIFVRLIFIANVLALIASYFYSPLYRYRKALGYLLLAYISGPIIVAFMKSHTHIYTPWKLALFDSYRPYIRMFDPAPENLPYGHAFPGGHSSGGFGLIALYIYAQSIRHPLRNYALAFVLLVGGVFAIGQEVRGAHLVSHDLLSLSICWAAAFFWIPFFYGMKRTESVSGEVS